MGYYRIGAHLRLRPSSKPSPALHADAATSTLRVDLRHADGGPPRSHDDQMVFHFDSIIQSTSQEATFNDCAVDIVDDVLCGYNGTILAYGQSGSGKTFSMSGDHKNALHKGIIPRAIQRVFADKCARPDSETSIYVSYLEVYNEVIYDLLTDRKEPLRIVTIMEENCQMEMKGLRQFLCETEEEALKYFLYGERRRSVSTNTIHKAVSELRKGQGHVSFRQSRLTMLLRDALGGNSKTVLIVCALQEHDFLDETISALRFAQRVKDLKTSAVVNKVVDSVQAERQLYERKIAELKRELAFHDALNGRAGISRDGLTEQRRVELKGKVEAFLSQKEDVDTIPIESLAQIKETYYIFKEAQSMLHAKLEKLSKESSMSKLDENQTVDMMDDNDGVGELEAQGVSVGIAPLDWRPAKMVTGDGNALKADGSAMLQQSLNEGQSPYGGDSKKRNLAFREFKHTVSEGIQQCYILTGKKLELKNFNASTYTFTILPTQNEAKAKNIACLLTYFACKFCCFCREKKVLMQNLSVKLIDCKREIHEFNLLVTEQASGMTACEQTEAEQMKAGDEQGQIKERLEQAKAEYQKCFADFLLSKAQIQSVRKEILECQESLLDSFFKWYKSERQLNTY